MAVAAKIVSADILEMELLTLLVMLSTAALYSAD